MNPAQLALIIQGLQAAIASAPQVIAVADKARELIRELFTADVITIEQQAALHNYLDQVQTAALGGTEPPHWTVEPDPA